MIERLMNCTENVLAFVCNGHVTKADYDAVLVPAVINALRSYDRARVYYETGAHCAGIDPGAIREDFKLGMEHVSRGERVAVVIDIEWIRPTMRLVSFLMPGAMKSLPVSQSAQARAWVGAKN
jgi:hypothetical protein